MESAGSAPPPQLPAAARPPCRRRTDRLTSSISGAAKLRHAWPAGAHTRLPLHVDLISPELTDHLQLRSAARPHLLPSEPSQLPPSVKETGLQHLRYRPEIAPPSTSSPFVHRRHERHASTRPSHFASLLHRRNGRAPSFHSTPGETAERPIIPPESGNLILAVSSATTKCLSSHLPPIPPVVAPFLSQTAHRRRSAPSSPFSARGSAHPFSRASVRHVSSSPYARTVGSLPHRRHLGITPPTFVGSFLHLFAGRHVHRWRPEPPQSPISGRPPQPTISAP